MITDLSFYVAAVPAVVLMGLSKGGFSGLGLLSLPLMALVVSPVQSAAIMLPILIIQDVVTVWAYRRYWDRRNLAILIPSSIVGIVSGYLLAARVSDAAVTLAVGVISIAFAVRRLIVERRAMPPDPTKADVPHGLFWGTVIGFTSMVAHAGGPPFQIYVMPQRLPRDIFVGTGAICFALINWIKVPPYLALGQFTHENLTTAAALFPVAVVSTWLGVLLVRRTSGERFYTLVYLLLVLVGAKLIVDGIRTFL
ncbi:sulfite exporter TauE/SafE family protein [Microvirga puerhi]|uniref:Probable membrane transporter protein n=1 Tax=Microvirga puerhi TaxID=2876078 RepID=A0ABS7VQI8_9HYPH|nr:sulfite exporter TauE/SafE family protein [Microvirga puerhi]MBZ6077325.1 sulfite exporter TauE/SafE family protein [Microvirga puerhi]